LEESDIKVDNYNKTKVTEIGRKKYPQKT